MADTSSRAGTSYITPEILDYIQRIHAPHDAGLARAFHVPEGIPAIQLAPSEARLIQLLLRLVSAKKVVEVGTLIGYSGINILKALPDDGRLWTLELDAHHAEVARANFEAAGYGTRAEVLVGPALSNLPGLAEKGPFDAVFIDADKASYDQYVRWAMKVVRPGGLLLVDNAFLFGHLVDDGEVAEAVRRCHEEAREVFDTVCIPTPDGLLLGIRRG
jgi:caffeoyl-CoA O-methyltransferase